MNISFVNNNHNNSTEEQTMSRQMSEHRKLCRVSRGTKVPMGSTPPTLIADMTALSLLQRRQTGRNDDDADADDGVVHFVRSYDNRNRKRLETVDSDPCYSSDGEHSNLSRNASTNSDCFLRTGDATGGCESECEYSCSKSLVTPHDSGYSSSVPFVDSATDFPSLNNDEYASLLDFTLKLGYSEAQLRTVLQRLSSSTSSSPSPLGQNNLLAELIKLGQDVSSAGGNNIGQDVGGGSSSSCSRLSPNSANQQQHGVAAAFAVGVNNVSSPDSSVAAACLGVGGGGISSGLRAIVIDGSNVAMTHGHKEVFSCKGVKDCVDWFKKRGHTDIKVFVPQFRKEAPRSDSPITDQHLLFELEQEKILVWTPSRRLGGRRIICYDDRYIVKTASEKDAVIVSNDEYRDVMKENPEFKKVIEERLLMYSFVDGKFMPPDDPLGRYGPQLVQFLRKGVVSSSAPNCPYGRKCTYGNKCKYSHPERPGGGYKSVTDRLRDHADFHKRISPSNSLQSPPRMLNANEACSTTAANNSKPIACRSQSLNQQGCLRQQSPSPGRQSSPQQSCLAYHQQNQQQMHLQARRTFSSASNQHHHHSQQQNHHQQNQDFMHRDLSNRSSNPETSGFVATDCCSSPGGAPFYVGADGFLMPPSVHHIWQQQQHLGHTPIGRNLSAPGVTPSSVGCYAAGNLQNGGGASRSPASPQHQQRRKNSISDSQLNLVGQSFVDTCCSNNDDVFQTASRAGSSAAGAEPSWSSVWGPLENSSVPLFASSPPPPPTCTANWSAAQHSQISRVNTLPLVAAKIPVHSTASAAPPTNNQTNVVAAASCSDEKRLKLYYHLSQLFPADVVAAVLAANPHELDAQKLCPVIIAVQNSNGQRCHGNNVESYMARSTT